MSDITKCKGVLKNDTTCDVLLLCPLRDKCWRYKAPKEKFQSWMEAPYDSESGVCEWLWELPS